MICVLVPVRVTVAVPLPAMVAVPPATTKLPWPTLRVTVMLPSAASTSATLRPLITFAVSSSVLSAAGTVLTGASLTAVTVMDTVALSVKAAPPVLPPSLVVMLRVSAPM